MGVDGIGGGGRRPVHGPGAVDPASVPSIATPDVGGAGAAAAPQSVGSAALERLQRGEIGVAEYLDTRVSEATKHLTGRVAPSELEFVQRALREQLSSDPVLAELVRRTTGTVPPLETE
jgi:hypothetical protein